MHKILVTGAGGQLGTELVEALQKRYGFDAVVASDIKPADTVAFTNYRVLNVLDESAIESVLREEKITQVYHLAAMLSAVGEKNPLAAWNLNMSSLLYVLEAARKGLVERVFWPSSIAVFGPDTPKVNTPQNAPTNPTTVYGISKLSGEQWCHYYFEKYGVDVRSIRYPGLIGYKGKPGGGTTDYAVEIFHEVTAKGKYSCFLEKGTYLPMMYMDDAIRATIELMEAEQQAISVRTSYNLAALSFTPEQLVGEIVAHEPNISITYRPDDRQKIANSWPQSIDDSTARADWGWQEEYDLSKMVKTMLDGVKAVV